MSEQHLEDAEGLLLELDLDTLLAQLAGTQIELERAEAKCLRACRLVLHFGGCLDPSFVSRILALVTSQGINAGRKEDVQRIERRTRSGRVSHRRIHGQNSNRRTVMKPK